MTRGARAHSKRGPRDLRERSAATDTEDKAGDVSHRARAPRLSVASFRAAVWKYWKESGRHDLPWRKTKDPYKILVSEVMLQQTQVPRVIEKYKEFLKKFPTVTVLAKAPLSDVLKVWSGLGYNRRGKYLHDAAKEIARIGDIKEALTRPLPGVGPYTRAAVRVFAFNEPHTMIETNIRAVYIHHFYSSRNLCYSSKDGRVTDKELLPIILMAAEGQDPREWHWALMDYGVHIKKLHKNPARRSAGYAKQSRFEGSLRQIRGAILRYLNENPKGDAFGIADLPFVKERIESALAGLEKDGLIVKVSPRLIGPGPKKGKWRVS